MSKENGIEFYYNVTISINVPNIKERGDENPVYTNKRSV